jgi:hypothetical protein
MDSPAHAIADTTYIQKVYSLADPQLLLLMSPWDNLCKIIQADDFYAVQEYPGLSVLLGAGITVSGNVPGPRTGRKYADPSFEQYAVVLNLPEALRGLLSVAPDFDSCFSPAYSNTKADLLTLAIVEGHAAIVDALFAHIRDRGYDAGKYANFAGPARTTPLKAALQSEQPDLVRVLIEHGADPLAAGPGELSAFILAVLDYPEQLKLLVEAAGARLAPLLGGQWDEDFRPVGAGGRKLSDVLMDKVPERMKASRSVLTQLNPSFGEAETVQLHRQAGGAQAAEQGAPSEQRNQEMCAGSDCYETQTLTRCPKCNALLCPVHVEGHLCSSQAG